MSSTQLNPAVEAISAFFPCYNDDATIASMVRIAVATLDRVGVLDGEVIVIDDGSFDNSPKVLAELAADEPMLTVVTHDRNRGYGGALLSGFAAAKKQWVFYTDGDGQFDPAELELLVRHASDDVDVVQGYKLRRADGMLRRVIGRMYHRFVAFFFGLRIRDTDCDFRLIRQSSLDEIELVHTTGVICVELVRKLQDSGARFTEVGVHHYRRVYGKSEFFRLPAIARTLWDLAGLWVGLVVLRRGRSRALGRSGRRRHHDDRRAEGHVAMGEEAALGSRQRRERAVEGTPLDVGRPWCGRRGASRSRGGAAARGRRGPRRAERGTSRRRSPRSHDEAVVACQLDELGASVAPPPVHRHVVLAPQRFEGGLEQQERAAGCEHTRELTQRAA